MNVYGSKIDVVTSIRVVNNMVISYSLNRGKFV